MVVSVKFN